MTISVVQTASAEVATSSSTLTATFASAVTAGNTIVVCIAHFDAATSGVHATSVTIGAAADHFGIIAGPVAPTGEIMTSEIWADPSCAGGGTAVAVTLSAAVGNISIVCYEVSGLLSTTTASALVDRSSTGTASSATWSSGSTATTTQANELWVGTACTFQAPTGPGAPWVNTEPAGDGTFIMSGRQVVSATGTAVYSGTEASTGQWSAIVVTLLPATGTTPSVFTPPRRPAKGAAAAVRGRGQGSPGAAYVAFPSHFTLPGKPARGASAAAKGRTESTAGKFTVIVPPVISPFPNPGRPARGASGTRQGSGRGQRGAPYVAFPSAFVLPRAPARGAPAAAPGRGHGSAGAPFVRIATSPFILPRRPAQGRPGTRRGSGQAGSATGHGAPVTPRQLIVSIASQAGTDDYGNAFPQGVLALAGRIQGPQVIVAGTGGEILVYSPAPGAGNMIASVAGTQAADAYGNTFLEGITNYGPAIGGNVIAITMINGIVVWSTAPSQAGPWTNQSSVGFGFGGAGSTITLNASNEVTVGNSGAMIWNDATRLLDIIGGTVQTASLIVNGQTISVPQGAPPTVPAAPASYNQSPWGNGVVNALNYIISVLGGAGIIP